MGVPIEWTRQSVALPQLIFISALRLKQQNRTKVNQIKCNLKVCQTIKKVNYCRSLMEPPPNFIRKIAVLSSYLSSKFEVENGRENLFSHYKLKPLADQLHQFTIESTWASLSNQKKKFNKSSGIQVVLLQALSIEIFYTVYAQFIFHHSKLFLLDVNTFHRSSNFNENI